MADNSGPTGFRVWYLRVVAALAPFIIAMETYQITSQFRQGGVSNVNAVDVILLLAWGWIFVKFTAPYADRLLRGAKKK